MAITYVIDTHALLWFIIGSPKLGANAKAILQDTSSQLILPATVLAEAFWIIERGRVSLTIGDLLKRIDTDNRIAFFPLDRAVIARSDDLKVIGEMHDRQITATALLLIERGMDVALLTRDSNITSSGLVPIVW